MKTMLRILLLEDDATDADLITHELEAAGLAFQIARIQTETELRRELETETPDLILSDHGLPAFDGFTALEIVREERPELPFIFVSGSNDQGMVAKMYEQGATDYVFKKDLGDLKAAIVEALNLTIIPATGQLHSPQPELKLQLPVIPPAKATISLPLGRLTFCPNCRQAWDEIGYLVDVERYFSGHAEIVVIRQLCAECRQAPGRN